MSDASPRPHKRGARGCAAGAADRHPQEGSRRRCTAAPVITVSGLQRQNTLRTARTRLNAKSRTSGVSKGAAAPLVVFFPLFVDTKRGPPEAGQGERICQCRIEQKANFYYSENPKFRISISLSLQRSLTLTQVCKNTFVPIKCSISTRASSPIFFSICPFLPMIMPLWLAFSQ